MNTFLRSDLFVSMCNCHFWWRWTFIEWFYSACSIDRWTCDICSRWTSSEQLLCNLMMSDHFEMSPERWTSIKWTSPSVVTEQSTVTDVNEQHPWNAFLQVLFPSKSLPLMNIHQMHLFQLFILNWMWFPQLYWTSCKCICSNWSNCCHAIYLKLLTIHKCTSFHAVTTNAVYLYLTNNNKYNRRRFSKWTTWTSKPNQWQWWTSCKCWIPNWTFWRCNWT